MIITQPYIRITLKTALCTGAAILIYEATSQLLLYRYIKFDYYIAVVAVAALATGVFIAKRPTKSPPVIETNPYGDVGLTAKEMYILSLISQGKSNKELAAINFVEVSTIKTHINNLYGKLKVTNRKDAIGIYQKHLANAKSTLYPPGLI